MTWPGSYALSGYTTFTFAFESQEEARAWHGHVAAALELLTEQHHARHLGTGEGASRAPSTFSVATTAAVERVRWLRRRCFCSG